jgi:hypothetical protein
MPAIPGTARQDRPVQGGHPGTTARGCSWTPAFAGVTKPGSATAMWFYKRVFAQRGTRLFYCRAIRLAGAALADAFYRPFP